MFFLHQISAIAIMKFIIDFVLVWICIYFLLRIMRNNERAGQILKGFLIVFLARYLALWLGLKIIERFLAEFVNWGVLAIIIIFAPEIRSALENVGKTTSFSKNIKLMNSEKEALINEIISAVSYFSKTYTGALITIERNDSLNDYIKSGIIMNADVTHELLGNIFYPKTPLHDGAVIIQGNKIACAAAFFLPTSANVKSEYGARHRAALGISEMSDSITIIVSEETGKISVAIRGQIIVMQLDLLRSYLENELSVEEFNPKEENQSLISNYLATERNAKKTGKDRFHKSEVLENGERISIYYRSGGNKYGE